VTIQSQESVHAARELQEVLGVLVTNEVAAERFRAGSIDALPFPIRAQTRAWLEGFRASSGERFAVLADIVASRRRKHVRKLLPTTVVALGEFFEDEWQRHLGEVLTSGVLSPSAEAAAFSRSLARSPVLSNAGKSVAAYEGLKSDVVEGLRPGLHRPVQPDLAPGHIRRGPCVRQAVLAPAVSSRVRQFEQTSSLDLEFVADEPEYLVFHPSTAQGKAAEVSKLSPPLYRLLEQLAEGQERASLIATAPAEARLAFTRCLDDLEKRCILVGNWA
jgi:hypothetical protein